MKLEHRIQKLERAINGDDDLTGPGAMIRALDIIAAQVYQGREPTEAEREFMSKARWPSEVEAMAQRCYHGAKDA